ncbi:hypothetical protein BJY04DRAFT_106799 [Aspergillus karnatakaensis]|uniref:uncharacterized protein n=1 Tax=Aspergillus karnatakaensis TaxID=1810916 RepID=UPI003CCD81DC
MATQPEIELVDLVIIGAGWHGLSAIKTALALNSSTNVLLLDSASSIGGVWAEERLYPSLRTNNRLGSYEFSDFPMQENLSPGLVQPGEHIPGRAVHEYLNAYVDHFGFRDRIRLGWRVDAVEFVEEWIVTCTTTGAEESRQQKEGSCRIRTPKLILATGLTSQPRIPTFPGQDSFDAPLFHIKAFGHYQDALFSKRGEIAKPHKQDTKDILTPISILGGSKSAWDAVYACASQGHPVNWIIRSSGTGPSWMTPARVFAPLNLLLESLPGVRVLS